jgi:hypothetical protein
VNRDVACASALVAASVALAGCGGSTDAAPKSGAAPTVSTAMATDRMPARSALLRADDLPAGWAADPGARRQRCRRGGTFGGVTAVSASDSFTRGNVNVQQTVWLFRDVAAARAAWQAMGARTGKACFRLQVSARVEAEDSVFVRPLRGVRQVRQTGGVRRSLLTGRISRMAAGPFGPVQTEMVVNVDEVERLRGRGISTIVVVSAAEEPDPAVIGRLVATAGRRLGVVVSPRRAS